jgi:predicted lipoprotein
LDKDFLTKFAGAVNKMFPKCIKTVTIPEYALNRYRITSVLGLILVLMLSSACKLATIKSIEEAEAAQQGFDAVAYVDGIWGSQVLPTIESDATDLAELLAALDDNEDAAIAEYGHRSGTGPFSFMVRGSAQVISIDTSSRAGLMLLDLPPYDGKPDISMAIGPVIRGNAIRDAVGFIKYEDFTNQMEFASIYREINNRVKDEILGDLDFESFPGKTINFRGAFTLEEGDGNLIVVPVWLEEQE